MLTLVKAKRIVLFVTPIVNLMLLVLLLKNFHVQIFMYGLRHKFSDELCTDRKSLIKFLEVLPFPWQIDQLLSQTGCKRPCQYFKYDVRYDIYTCISNIFFVS